MVSIPKKVVSIPKKVVIKKNIISIVIYIFRGHVWAYMKDNEMLFEIIYIYIVVCRCGFSVIQVKAPKFTENDVFKRTESQEEIQTT